MLVLHCSYRTAGFTRPCSLKMWICSYSGELKWIHQLAHWLLSNHKIFCKIKTCAHLLNFRSFIWVTELRVLGSQLVQNFTFLFRELQSTHSPGYKEVRMMRQPGLDVFQLHSPLTLAKPCPERILFRALLGLVLLSLGVWALGCIQSKHIWKIGKQCSPKNFI